MRAHRQRRDADRGFIIVAVLWIILALATLASIYAVYVVRTAYALGPSDDRIRADALFTAALELTAYRLTALPPDRRPSNGRADFRMGGATVTARFASEAARIDLNAAPKPLLTNLFAVLGARFEDAEQFADRIIAWRTQAQRNGQTDAESEAYRVAGRNYGPRHAPFEDVAELWLVRDLPPAMVERALPYVTVFSGAPQINILDAAPTVLAALPGVDRDQVNAVLAVRQTPQVDGQAVLAALATAKSSATIQVGRSVRVSVNVQFERGSRANAEIVILLRDDAQEPYRILSWRDDFDQVAPGGG